MAGRFRLPGRQRPRGRPGGNPFWFVLGCSASSMSSISSTGSCSASSPSRSRMRCSQRRPARADRRPLFRDVLLLHRDPGRLVRGPHQPRRRPVARLRDLERGDRRVRAGGKLPQLVVARMVVGFGEAGGRAAVLCDHHRHLSARQARRGARHLQSRPGDRRGAGRGIRRRDRRAVRLAHPLHRIGAIGIVTAILVRLSVREPTRGATDDGRARARHMPTRPPSGRRCACSSRIRC
jgi:hypothetical protein